MIACLGSSEVERLDGGQEVEGSNPSRGAGIQMYRLQFLALKPRNALREALSLIEAMMPSATTQEHRYECNLKSCLHFGGYKWGIPEANGLGAERCSGVPMMRSNRLCKAVAPPSILPGRVRDVCSRTAIVVSWRTEEILIGLDTCYI